MGKRINVNDFDKIAKKAYGDEDSCRGGRDRRGLERVRI